MNTMKFTVAKANKPKLPGQPSLLLLLPPSWRLGAGITTILAVFSVTSATVSAAESVTSVFVADGGRNLIRQYAPSGYEIRQITNAQFNFPTLLAFDSSTTTLITDINFTGPDAPDLVRFDLQGNIIARNTSSNIFGQRGGGIIDVVGSRHGSFFVTSTLNTEIAEVDLSLKVIRRFSSGSTISGLPIFGAAVSEDAGRLYVANGYVQPVNGFIRIFDANAGLQIGGITNAALVSPFLPRFSSSGLLYVSDRGQPNGTQDKILVFDQNGTLVRQFTTGATTRANFGLFAVLPDGRLAVLRSGETNSSIRILTATGQFVSQIVTPSLLWAIAVGQAQDPCVLTNEAEAFSIRGFARNTNGAFMLSWDSCSGHLYEVQASEALSSQPVWTRCAIMIGSDGATTWVNTNAHAADRQFYSVQRFSFYGDQDGDGLGNLTEFNRGTDLRNSDSDGDGMQDAWEAQYGFNPLDPKDQHGDLDGDGYNNGQEYHFRTRPNVAYHRPANLPRGLVAWWKMDEGMGTHASDSSLNGHHGYVLGGNATGTWTTGFVSNGLTLGGPANNWVEVPYHASLAPTQEFTLMGWVKPTGQGILIGNRDFGAQVSGNYRLQFQPDEIALSFSPAGDGTFSTVSFNPNWSANDWHHIAVSYSRGTNVAVFVDGERRASLTVTGPFVRVANPILIGFPGMTNVCSVDDVRIYDRALATNEIASLSRGNGLPVNMIVGQTASLRAFGASEGDTCQWSVVSGQGFFTNAVSLTADFRPAWSGALTVRVVCASSGVLRTNFSSTTVAFPGLSPVVGWNAPDVQPFNNCYNFSVDIRTDTFAQPGVAGGTPAAYPPPDCQPHTSGAVVDGLKSGIDLNDLCHTSGLPEGHIVALMVWPGVDFHFVRLEPNGMWSSKAGNLPATMLDNSGQPIADPRTADFDAYRFCSFFWVGPDVQVR